MAGHGEAGQEVEDGFVDVRREGRGGEVGAEGEVVGVDDEFEQAGQEEVVQEHRAAEEGDGGSAGVSLLNARATWNTCDPTCPASPRTLNSFSTLGRSHAAPTAGSRNNANTDAVASRYAPLIPVISTPPADARITPQQNTFRAVMWPASCTDRRFPQSNLDDVESSKLDIPQDLYNPGGEENNLNSDIRDLATWARSQGWKVEDTAAGYTRFFDPDGEYIARYPATPSNPRRRLADLTVKLKAAGLPVPPPSKKEQRAERRRASMEGAWDR